MSQPDGSCSAQAMPARRLGQPPTQALGRRRLKLAYVTTLPGTQWGFLKGQNAFMRAHGFELHSISSPGRFMQELEKRDGVVPHPVSISREIRPIRDFRALIQILLVFVRVRPDIVHLSTPKAAALGAIAAWLARVPARVFLVRGLASEGARGIRGVSYRALERLTARLCHQSICVSPSLLRYARAAGVLGEGEGIVIEHGMSNGVDARRFDPDGPKPPGFENHAHEAVTIGYVGRLAVDKGIREIAGMWEIIRDRHPHTRLLLVGGWENYSGDTSAARETFAADPRVSMPGRVADVVPYYRVMDIFILPSHREGFPNAPMEAAAMGLPVVATRVSGCLDSVIDGVTGLLVEPRNIDGLSDAVSAYVLTPQVRKEHGKRGRERVLRDFQSKPIWQGLLHEYRRLLDES